MVLRWEKPRAIRAQPDDLYKQLRHWLVDSETGRILASVSEPRDDAPQDSFDVKLYFTHTDDEAYFVTLDQAKVWMETRTLEAHRKKHIAEAAEGVVAEKAKTE